MRIIKAAALAACALAAFAPATAGAVTIDFQDLNPGYHPTAQVVYSEATFTASTGVFYIGATTGKNLCPVNVSTCDADLTVDFTNAVSNLSFTIAGDNDDSTISWTAFFGAGGSTSGSFINDGLPGSQDLHSFGALTDIIKVTFSDNDLAGLTWDNFTFDVNSAVPEPASWAMMIGGFALAGGAMRRRKAAVSFA